MDQDLDRPRLNRVVVACEGGVSMLTRGHVSPLWHSPVSLAQPLPQIGTVAFWPNDHNVDAWAGYILANIPSSETATLRHHCPFHFDPPVSALRQNGVAQSPLAVKFENAFEGNLETRGPP